MKEGAQVQMTLNLWREYAYTEPADVYLHHGLKKHRFMGAKDRRLVRDLFFHLLRREVFLRDKLASVQNIIPFENINEQRALFLLDLKDRKREVEIPRVFTGHEYDPSPLNDFEREMMELTDIPSLTPHGALSLSPFWYDKLTIEFGKDLESHVAAFAKEAPLDIRVNTLKTTREEALLKIKEQNVEGVKPTPFSPHGIRIDQPKSARRRPDISAFVLDGLMEPQDEGSQLIAMMVDAAPGMRVLDYCAGAGGKTLSLAMHMENKGSLVASDISKSRLERAGERLRRLGIFNTTCVLADSKWRKKKEAHFDRVLVDAPCSGSGTWRRNPDLMLRTGKKDIEELMDKQRMILKEAAPMVKIGGRLIYATCSLIKDENSMQVTWFLKKFEDRFRIVPLSQIWHALVNDDNTEVTPPPNTHNTWQLTPAKHYTDGFFMACFERIA